MENLRDQISELRNHIHQLDQTIESMPRQIISVLSMHGLINGGSVNTLSSINHVSRESLEYNFSHKDILEEDNACDSKAEQIPCEWQVGRLSAQLTSAYERIAALEKQLLSRHLASR